MPIDDGSTDLVIPLVSSPELADQSDQDQISDLRQFRIDDRNQCSEDWSKG
jgi:hypothetical protein